MLIMFHFESEEELQQTLLQCKQAALQAIPYYQLDWDQIRFNQLSGTCTFVLETQEKQKLLLRIHSGMDIQEIEAELLLLESLHANSDLIIPQGLVSAAGSRVITLERDGNVEYHATLLSWVEGEHSQGALTDDQVYQEGVLLAKLHQAAEGLTLAQNSNFKRPAWGQQTFQQAWARLTKYYSNFLREAEFQLYREAADRVSSWLATLSVEKNSYGLIHGDLHQGNIVFHDGQPRAIDFGRCGYGFFTYDMAHVILGLYPAQRKLVIQGYESIRMLDQDWYAALEAFAVMVLIENTSHHAPNPRETESLQAEQPYAQAILQHYLDGKPFLFNAIEINQNSR